MRQHQHPFNFLADPGDVPYHPGRAVGAMFLMVLIRHGIVLGPALPPDQFPPPAFQVPARPVLPPRPTAGLWGFHWINDPDRSH